FAGLAIDVANWWFTAQRVQRAADSAALAGVVHMPDDIDEARSTAADIATRNGYTHGAGSTIVSEEADRPSQLRVTITTSTKNFFAGIVGLDSTTITRTAVADYTGSVPMGSPAD